jgi:hypothetical protein
MIHNLANSILIWNCRSLKQQIAQIDAMLTNSKQRPILIALTESRVKPNFNHRIKNYTLISSPTRGHKDRTPVAALVRNDINATLVKSLTFNNHAFSVIWLHLKNNNSVECTIAILYRRPYPMTDDEWNSLDENISSATTMFDCPLFIAGDLNARHRIWDTKTNKEGRKINSIMQHAGLTCLNSRHKTPTHDHNSVIDLIFASDTTAVEQFKVDANNDLELFSDHRPLVLQIQQKQCLSTVGQTDRSHSKQTSRKPTDAQQRCRWNAWQWNNADWNLYRAELNDLFGEDHHIFQLTSRTQLNKTRKHQTAASQQNTINDMNYWITDAILVACEIAVPKGRQSTQSMMTNWFKQPGVKEAHREMKSNLRRLRRHPNSLPHQIAARTSKQHFNSLRKKAKQQAFQELTDSFRSAGKRPTAFMYWQAVNRARKATQQTQCSTTGNVDRINSIKHVGDDNERNSEIDSLQQSLNSLAKHFSSNSSTHHHPMHSQQTEIETAKWAHNMHHLHQMTQTGPLYEFSLKEVQSVLASTETDKATGPDSIHGMMLKQLAECEKACNGSVCVI